MQPVRVRGGRQHKKKHINGKETEIKKKIKKNPQN